MNYSHHEGHATTAMRRFTPINGDNVLVVRIPCVHMLMCVLYAVGLHGMAWHGVAWRVRYSRGSLQVLNQLKLPHETEYVDISGAEDAFKAIKTMMVGKAKLTSTAAKRGSYSKSLIAGTGRETGVAFSVKTLTALTNNNNSNNTNNHNRKFSYSQRERRRENDT